MKPGRLVTEILDAHAERIKRPGGRRQAREYALLFPHYAREVAPLMGIAERLQGLARPAMPRLEFRLALKEELLRAARRPRARRPGWRSPLVWGAAGGLAALLAGLAAWKRRQQRPTAPVPSG